MNSVETESALSAAPPPHSANGAPHLSNPASPRRKRRRLMLRMSIFFLLFVGLVAGTGYIYTVGPQRARRKHNA